MLLFVFKCHSPSEYIYICSAARYFARIRTLGVLLALRLISGNSACLCQAASWVCNAATKIHQTDKEALWHFSGWSTIAAIWGEIRHFVASVIRGNRKANTVLICRCLFCCIAVPSLFFFPSAQFHYLLTFLLQKRPRLFSSCFVVILSYHFTPTFRHWFMFFCPSFFLSMWAWCSVLPQN